MKHYLSANKLIRRLLPILLYLFIAGTGLQAQTVMLRGGLNHSKFRMVDNDANYSDDLNAYIGGHIAGVVDLRVNETLSFDGGLMFGTKGARKKVETSILGQPYTLRERDMLVYAEIPINVKVRFVAGDARIVLNAGPSIGYGLYGTIRTSYTGPGGEDVEVNTVSWGDGPEDQVERLDYGIQVGGGLEFSKKYYAGIQYSSGIANISAVKENGQEINNRVISLMFGYIFDLDN